MKALLNLAVITCLSLAAASVPAAEETDGAMVAGSASGLPVGESTLSFTVMDVTGPYKGKRICYVCEYQDEPNVIGFFKEPGDEAASMIVKLNDLYKSNKDRGLQAFAVVMSGQDAMPWLEELNKAEGIEIPLVVLRKGPKDLAVRLYHLEAGLSNTFMVNINREVKANFAGISPDEFSQVADAANHMLSENNL